ncbi:arylsulfatase [Gaetbulibacter sp. M240]|uniref:arylsulfatase n=1 Tax=Gaetbulibacter sp. M240 TaxID=3126511 RepID=UPI00374F791A
MMKIKNVLFILILTAALFSCKNESKNDIQSQEINHERPNIIYILADDLGYADVGVYGQSKFNTPNLDKLAKDGMLFTQHYAGSTVCAPSRSVLLSGMHTGHTSIRGNKEFIPEGQHPMAAETYTIAEMLKDAGYTTGAFGKWGLGFVGTDGDPNKQGFDEFYGYNCQRQAHRYYPEHLWHNSEKVLLEGNEGFKKTNNYAGYLIHDKALNFIETNKDKPFFLFYPNVAPHAELIVPEAELEKFRGKYEEKPFINTQPGANYGDEKFDVKYYTSQPEPRATFAAMVTLLDQQVGDIMAKLKELGLAENTIIMFSSDNGPHQEGGADPDFFDSNGQLKGYKRDLYEGGVRVPMIVSWPSKIQGNTQSDHISAFWDIMPTLAELAKVEAPQNIDGISFLPELLGKEQKDHDFLYWEFHEQGGKKAVRKGKWKAVKLNCFNPSKTKIELYDLSSDLGEEHNVADEYPEIVKELSTIMENEHEENAEFPFKANVSNNY